MLGFAPLTSVPLSSLPVATGRAATGFVTGGFGTPIAAYARTQTATGIAPTTQLPTPRGLKGLPVTGFCSTAFGTGTGTKQQRPTGFLAGVLGTPRIFPFNTVGFRSTQFGAGRLFPYHVAPGVHSTQFGSVNGWQHWRVLWAAPSTRFGAPFITFAQARTATGFSSTRVGTPSKVNHQPAGVGWLCRPSAIAPGAFGTPNAAQTRSAQASGFICAVLGTHAASAATHAVSVPPNAVGAPQVRLSQRAASYTAPALPTPSYKATLTASGFLHAPQFGLPASDRSNTYKVYGVNASGRLGQPNSTCRFNYRPTGFAGAQLGTPACRERHLARHLQPGASFGRPLLRRITQC